MRKVGSGDERLAAQGSHAVSVQWNQNSGSFIPELYFAFILRATNYMMRKTWFLLSGNSAVKGEIPTETHYCSMRLSVVLEATGVGV